jgi:Flp pilus assembly protein TadD
MVARIVLATWLAGVALFSVGCASAAKSEMQQQWNFGIGMARRGSWKEALFRFRRSVELTPENALLHNNLAVAYESVGDYRKADSEYRRALELDPDNERIRANFTSFQTFYGDLLEPTQEPDSEAPAPQSGSL